MALTYAISFVKWTFGKHLLENMFCFSSMMLNY